VTGTNSTKENINKLIEFRQAVYEHGMTARRDAMFDLLDALIAQGPVSSFARLSQARQFRRKWPSLYTSVEDGRVDKAWLRKFLAKQVAQSGVCVFALDGSPWPRPRAKTLDDRQYVFQASSDVNGGKTHLVFEYPEND
jgi:hypothetical protein